MTDLYVVLELTKTATNEEIKKSYKRLALLHHPDRNPGKVEEATTKFKAISEAYSILNDPDKRKIYDTQGIDGLKNTSTATPHPFPFGFPFSFHQTNGNTTPQPGADFRVDLGYSLRDLYNGLTKKIRVTRNVLCKPCGATGKSVESSGTCGVCRGHGFTVTITPIGMGLVQQRQVECTACDATGICEEAKCKSCAGRKIIRGETFVDVVVPKKTQPGATITFPGMADEAPNQSSVGKLIITINHTSTPSEDKGFKLHASNKADLMYDVTLSLKQALCGVIFTIEHLDGRSIKIDTSQDIITPGYIKTIRGEGLLVKQSSEEAGDLHVTFNVQFPNVLSIDARKRLLEALP